MAQSFKINTTNLSENERNLLLNRLDNSSFLLLNDSSHNYQVILNTDISIIEFKEQFQISNHCSVIEC